VEDLIGSEHLAPEVVRQEEEDDEEPAEDETDRQLEEEEVAVAGIVGDARHAEERDRAGFGGDDRQEHGPPCQVPAGQEIVGQVALAPSQPDAQGDDAQQVGDEDRGVHLADRRLHGRGFLSERKGDYNGRGLRHCGKSHP